MAWRELFSIKYGALLLLVLQNTFLVVCMRYSRIQQSQDSSPIYASSTAVVCMELVKFFTCIAVVGWSNRAKGLEGLYYILRDEVIENPIEVIKLSVPSLLYTVQNNLLYFALSHLEAATFQVGYQVKILTTAVFSVWMLNKSLSTLQWASLVLLTVGVSLAQLSAHANSADHEKENTTMGFIAVLLASVTSGFSGVYFEKILKNSSPSLWIRNIQMGISSILVGFASVYLSNDRSSVMQYGFFHGYNTIVVSVILLQAVGGLVVAVVVKYADNILKGFAASFSIITSFILTYFWFGFEPTWMFMIGAILVNVSMYLYSLPPPAQVKVHNDQSFVEKV